MRVGGAPIGTAPIGTFPVGPGREVQGSALLLPPPSMADLVRSGGGMLDGTVRLGSTVLPWTQATVTAQVDRAPSRRLTATVGLPDGWDRAMLRARLNPLGDRVTASATVTDPLSGASWSTLLATVVAAPPKLTLTDQGAVTIDLDLEDASQVAQQTVMQAPYITAAGQRIHTVVADLLARTIPWLPQDISLDVGPLPPGAYGGWGLSPWKVADDMARAQGAALRVDADGVARLHWLLVRGTTLAATWATTNGTLVDVSREVDADVMPQACLITYGPDAERESWPSPPQPGVVTMTADGDYSWVTDPVLAREIAHRELLRAQARRDRVDVTVPVDYRIDLDDRVRIVAPELDLDVTGPVQGITWRLGEPIMTATLTQEASS